MITIYLATYPEHYKAIIAVYMIKDYLDRIETIDRLIRFKATGKPKVLAQKLNVSESTLYEILTFMKERGAPIGYCRRRESYYYEYTGLFCFNFIEDSDEKVTMSR